jgi:Kef-type K+ transport system membrane component KefB
MQCKGLMEVLVLTVLLDAGIISSACYSTMIFLAVATTSLTMPLTRLFRRRDPALYADGRMPAGMPADRHEAT